MFRIVANYYDENDQKVTRLLFDNAIPDEDLKLINPKLTLEDNEPGSLEFTLPTFHRFYDLMGMNLDDTIDDVLYNADNPTDKRRYFLNNRDTQIIVYKDGEWYWEGFPSDYSRAFNGDYTIHCDGALAYLDTTRTDFGLRFYPLEIKKDDDTPSDDGTPNNTTEYINQQAAAEVLQMVTDEFHNDHIRSSSDKPIRIRHKKIYLALNSNGDYDCDVNPINEGERFYRTFNHETCYEAIKEKFITSLGGHLLTKRVFGQDAEKVQALYNSTNTDKITDEEVAEGLLVLSYHQNYNSIKPSSARIDFGENILDYTEANAFKDIATVIIPHGDTQSENDPFYVSSYWPIPNTTFYAHLGWRTTTEEHIDAYQHTATIPTADPRLFMGDDATGTINLYQRKKMQKTYGYVEKVVAFTNVVPRRLRQYVLDPTASGGGYYTYIDNAHFTNIEAYETLATVRNLNPMAITIPETWWTEGTKHQKDVYKNAYLNALFILGWDYLHNKQFDGITIEISAIDLSSRFGVENYTEFHLLDQVRCTSRPHGMINKSYPITKLEIPLDSVVNMKFTLNHTQRTLTGKIADSK